MKSYYVYIMASESGTLYIGVTGNLLKRVGEHREGAVEGFTKKYSCKKVVHFEETTDVHSALAREKQLKGWRKSKKVGLIESVNPGWRDLWTDWF